MRLSQTVERTPRAQAMVEFVLALPLLVLLIYGTVEVARLSFIFTSTSNASRAAARYGAGSGENSEGVPRYLDCDGIREVVDQSAFINEFDDINITYDRGVNSDGTQIPISGVDPSPSADSCPLEDSNLRNGDRIIVQVSTSYEPIVSIVPLEPLEIVSSSARTFIVSIPIMGSAMPLAFFAETSTPSIVPTEAFGTNTPTNTAIYTATTLPPFNITSIVATSTNSLTPSLTLRPSKTPPPSKTPLPSNTPTVTLTSISCTGLTGIGHGPLVIKDNVMELAINNNTNHMLFTAQIYVEWNHDTGHQQGNDHTLRLRQITLDSQTWNGDIFAPSKYLQDFYPTVPTGGSLIRFIFNQNYDVTDGTERIIINLGTPGCVSYPIDSRH